MNPINITHGHDGEFLNRQYSYWSSACYIGTAWYVFVGHADGRPRFFRVEGQRVDALGPLMSYVGTGEGWSWDATGQILLCRGPERRRVSPLTGEDHLVFSIADDFPGCDLWQAHASDDGRVHSATVRRVMDVGPYAPLGTVVWQEGIGLFYLLAVQPLDESQVSRDGRFLIIKEGDDNRIITLATGEERWVRNADGALGHSDCGPDYIVGEDDQQGACVRVDLTTLARTPLFPTWNMGHVSVRGGRCLQSDATYLSLVDMTSGERTIVYEHGMTGSGYDYQVHASLDPSGRAACFMSNREGRMDAYLLVLA